MTDSDKFVQINNQLPYKPIRSIQIINVACQNNKISIECNYHIQGNLNQINTLIRTQDDINWLIDNIKTNNKTCLIPKFNNQNYLNLIFQKLTMTQQNLKNEYQKKLKQKMIFRALKLISTVILNELKDKQQIYMYAIFIFFHKNFGLYKNPIYFKEQSSSLTKKMGNFIWEKYSLFSGAKIIKWSQIQDKISKFSNELSKLSQINLKLTQYINNLYKLQEQYIREKEIIKIRTNKIERLLLTFQNQIKYLQLVIDEIKETLARIENKNLSQNLMKEYNSFLQIDLQRSIKNTKQLMRYYIKVLCQNQEKIKIQSF